MPKENMTLNKVWITYKIRIFSEERYKKYDFLGFLVIQSASLFLINFSIFGEDVKKFLGGYNYVYDKISVAMAIIVFSTGICLWGFRFSETAAKHRDCYLKLGSLYSEYAGYNEYTEKDLIDKYNEILLYYPNHGGIDYDDFLIDSIVLRGIEIINPKDNKAIYITKYKKITGILRLIFRYSVYVMTFVFPLLPILTIWMY